MGIFGFLVEKILEPTRSEELTFTEIPTSDGRLSELAVSELVNSFLKTRNNLDEVDKLKISQLKLFIEPKTDDKRWIVDLVSADTDTAKIHDLSVFCWIEVNDANGEIGSLIYPRPEVKLSQQ